MLISWNSWKLHGGGEHREFTSLASGRFDSVKKKTGRRGDHGSCRVYQNKNSYHIIKWCQKNKKVLHQLMQHVFEQPQKRPTSSLVSYIFHHKKKRSKEIYKKNYHHSESIESVVQVPSCHFSAKKIPTDPWYPTHMKRISKSETRGESGWGMLLPANLLEFS